MSAKRSFFVLVVVLVVLFLRTGQAQLEPVSQTLKPAVMPAAGGLLFSTYLGSSDEADEGWDIAVHSSGVYIVGDTWCDGFPATSGAYDASCNGAYDTFVAKLSSDGSQLLWATFLGGSNYDYGRSVAVDSAGNVYVTGQTSSEDFPTTAGAYDRSYNGGSSDVFVAKLTANGRELVYSTYLGGSWPSGAITSDYPFGIAVDKTGHAYVAGSTDAPDFPTTTGAYDRQFDGTQDGFVTKFSADGTSLVYSTYLGGTSHEYCQAITVDKSDQAYVTGRTYSTDFPTTAGAYDTSHNGQHDAFVTKFKSDGSGLVYSTYLGGSDWDIGLDLIVSDNYQLYLSGSTESLDFPTAAEAYDETNNGREDAFVAKLSSDGKSVLFSTLIGGEYEDRASGVGLDSFGNVYVTGDTISSNFPTTDGAFDATHNGSWDAFVARISPNGSRLGFSSYLGGHTWDEGHAIAVGGGDQVYVTGRADSSTFPVTAGAFDTTFGPFRDGFVTKMAGFLPDLKVTGLEVTQGTQNLANDIPLVAQRGTFARAYLEQATFGYPDVPGVTAELRGYRGGSELIDSPVSSGPVSAQSDGGGRLDLNDSLLFRIPPAWRSGTVTLTVEINPSGPRQIEEVDLTNNVQTETLTFTQVTTPCLIFVPVHLHDGNGNDITYHVTDPGFARVVRGLHRYHPIPNVINWYYSDTLYPAGHAIGSEYDLSDAWDRQSLLWKLVWVSAWTDDPEDNCHFVGMVSPQADTTKGTGEVLGLARIGHSQSWVKMEDLSQGPYWFQQGAQSLGHELGHNKGLKHVDCAGSEDNTDDNYLWERPHCALADTDESGYYGLTVFHQTWGITQTVISNDPAANSPHQGFPFMGYQRPMWVSPWEYCKLLDTAYGVDCDLWAWSARDVLEREVLRDPAASLNPEELAPLDTAAGFVVVGGWVITTTSAAEISHVYQLDELLSGMRGEAVRNLAQRKLFGLTLDEPFTLVQVDGVGQILQSQEISLVEDDEADDVYFFLEVLPEAAGVAEIQVRKDIAILSSRAASANPPTVQLLSPHSGELAAGSVVSWSALDPDGDNLTFNVFYSADNGLWWKPLAMDLVDMTWELVSLEGLSGTNQGKVKVVANDGWHVGEDISDGVLVVPNSPPLAIIASPADGLTVFSSEVFPLEGMSTDNEDGPNSGGISWSSDIDGFLGDETELQIRGLSPGEHHITLTVQDSEGVTGSDTVTVFVVQDSWEIYLPLTLRKD